VKCLTVPPFARLMTSDCTMVSPDFTYDVVNGNLF